MSESTGWEDITSEIGEMRTDLNLEDLMRMYDRLSRMPAPEPGPILIPLHEWERLMDLDAQAVWTSHMEGDIEE